MLPRPSEKTGLVTHRGCLDGSGSAIVFELAGGRFENILVKDPGNCSLSGIEASKFDEVWFVDICPASLEDPAHGKPFRVIDHHKTNLKRHGPHHIRCTFDMTLCGTALFARELGLDLKVWPEYERLIAAIQAYDFGRFDVEDAMWLADVASLYKQPAMVKAMLRFGDSMFQHGSCVAFQEAVSIMRKQYAERIIDTAYDGYLCAQDRNLRYKLAVAPVYWKNEVAMALLESPGGGPDRFAAVYCPLTSAISLRSLPDGPDVATIAEMYGGGGHARAAGFSRRSSSVLQMLNKELFG